MKSPNKALTHCAASQAMPILNELQTALFQLPKTAFLNRKMPRAR
jgi:hypothetical protein